MTMWFVLEAENGYRFHCQFSTLLLHCFWVLMLEVGMSSDLDFTKSGFDWENRVCFGWIMAWPLIKWISRLDCTGNQWVLVPTASIGTRP